MPARATELLRGAARWAIAASIALSALPARGGAERADDVEQPTTGADQSEPYALVVNPGLGLTNVSLAEARRIFLGEQQFWPGGARVVLFVHAPGTPARAVALRYLYQMREDEFRRYWIAKTFRGDVTGGPKIVSTDALAKRLTAQIPGAVTVIRASDVDSTVKVLTVDGRAPGDPRYAIVGGGK